MIGFGLLFLIGLGVAARMGGDAVGVYVGLWVLLLVIGAGVSAGEDKRQH